MDQRRAAAALLALAACFACSTAAPTSNNQTALDLYDAPVEGCYYNFQHYGEGDRIMTNEPCLNCTCHNRMLMCYLRVCPFTKPIGQDCTVEKRADQCCPIVTCPDVPVDLLTSTSTSSPAEYGATGLGKLDKYGCSINGKYFPEGAKVPPAPNKPCEHCYCIHNMTTCVMQECTLHVDGCTPIYHKDVCCPIRYSCDHPEDEIPLLDDMTTTVRPTPGFLLTTTTMMPVTQATQECIHDDKIFPDGALIKTEKACEHCYCMKGDIVCVVQECGTPMENEGKNCTSLPPRLGQCCPDTYICEGDETQTTEFYEEITTLSPPRRVGVEGSGYRNEPDELYTEAPSLEGEMEGSGEEQPITTVESLDIFTSSKYAPESTSEYSTEPDKELNTVPDSIIEIGNQDKIEKPFTTLAPTTVPDSSTLFDDEMTPRQEYTTITDSTTKIIDETTNYIETTKLNELAKSTMAEVTTKSSVAISTSDNITPFDEGFILATKLPDKSDSTDSYFEEEFTTTKPSDIEEPSLDNAKKQTTMKNIISPDYATVTTEKISETETTSINVQENEIAEDLTPGRIPGEGDCLHNSITYKNNSAVPSSSKCHASCKCISSIIKCDPIVCTPPLEYMENMNDCHPIYDSPESCCPTYVCNTKETIAPESHNQMSGTETPKPTIECADDECRIIEGSKPTIGHEISNKDDCGENGCLETPVPDKDLEGCIGDKCDTHKEQYPITEAKPCDSDSGCQAPAIKPCDTNDCKTELESPIQDGKDVQEKPIDDVQPMNEDQEIICKEENCRRKEFSGVDQKTQCSGNDCLHQQTVAPESGLEISTQKTQTELTTRTDEDMAQHTNDLTITQNESTTKSQPPHLGETYSTESTMVAGLYTEEVQTTSPIISGQTSDDAHHEELSTQSPYAYDISTEHLEPTVPRKDDVSTESSISDTGKINTPSLDGINVDEHVTAVTESNRITEFTPEVTEKSSVVYTTISDESSSIDKANEVTVSKVGTETSEFTKQITTESYVTTETAKLDLSTVDKSISSQDTDISNQQPVTQIPDVTKSPYLEDKTTMKVFDESSSTNAPSLVTNISDETVTESVYVGTSTEKDIIHVEQTDKSEDEPLLEVTKLIETTTVEYSDTDSGSRNTPPDFIDHKTSSENMTEKETTEIHESSTIYTEIPKQDEKDEYSTIAELSTPREENIFDVSSTPAYKDESTETANEYVTISSSHEPILNTLSPDIKESEDQKGHETISTEIPELYTQAEEIATTTSIQYDVIQHSDAQGTVNDDGIITHGPEMYTEQPIDLSTESKLYSPPQETGTSEKIHEVVTEPPTLDHVSSEKTSDNLEHPTEIFSTTQSPIREEQSDRFTTSSEGIVTYADSISDKTMTTGVNIEKVENEQTHITENLETTTKSYESMYSIDTETKPSEGMIQQDETDIKTTLAYNEYYETTKVVTSTEIPVILENSTSPPVAYTETVNETVAVGTTTPQEDIKIEYITTKIPAMPTEGGIIFETSVSSEKPELEEITEAITGIPITDTSNTIKDDKPTSTVSDLSQKLYPTTTMKNYENSEPTQKVDINFSLPEEITTDKVPDMNELGATGKVTTIPADVNLSTSVYEDSVTEKVGSTEHVDLITTQSHDLRDTESISSTTSSILEAATEQFIDEITDITQIKEKETEAPMSLVTVSHSISTIPEVATESVQKTTGIESTIDMESHVVDTKPASETTLIKESFTTQKSETDNEYIAPPSKSITQYEYIKPTTETSGIITTTESELSTAKLLTTSQQISSEHPLFMYSEQQSEKDSTVETTQNIIDLLLSTTTENSQLEDQNKETVPEIITTEANEFSTKLDEVMVEKTPSTEKSFPHIHEEPIQDVEDITKSPLETSATEGHEISDNSSATEGTTQYPESSITETHEVTNKITEEALLHTTESGQEINTSSIEMTIDMEKTTGAEQNLPTHKPDIILSTVSSDKELVYESQSSTKTPESISDSTGIEENTYGGQTTQIETLATKIVMPDHSSTETYQESQTKEPTVIADENSTLSEKPETHIDQSHEDSVHTTESTGLLEIETTSPEEYVTKVSDESTSSPDKVTKSTLADMIITSTEHVSDAKVAEPETTTETKYKFSETTPYFVELEEHTHQIIQETTVIPVGEVSTAETTDVKSTERGDQLFTDISIDEDSQTEKYNEVTSESNKMPVTTPQFIEEQTSQEMYQTTASAIEYGSTSISIIESQKETDTKSDEQPIDLGDKTTMSPLPNIMQNEERITAVPEETDKPTSYFDTKIPVTTEKSHDLVEEEPQIQVIPMETKTPDEESLTTKLTTSYFDTKIPVTTEKSHDLVEGEPQKQDIPMETKTPDEESLTTKLTTSYFDTKIPVTTEKSHDLVEGEPQKQDIPLETTTPDEESLTTKLTTSYFDAKIPVTTEKSHDLVEGEPQKQDIPMETKTPDEENLTTKLTTSYFDTKIPVTTEKSHDLVEGEPQKPDIPMETKTPDEENLTTKLTTSYFDTKIPVTTEKSHDLVEGEPQKQDIPMETKTPDEETQTTKLTTSQIVYESTTTPPVKTTIAEDIYKPVDTSSATSKPITSKPLPSDLQPTEEIPTPDFPSSGYDQEPDYGEEDQAFGPGTCRYGGKVYVSAQQIPRDDPCDFCFCFRSDIICLQQSCPPPIHGCHEEPIQGFCCPRYECPVSMATTVNVTTTTTTTTTTLPPHFLPHAYKGAAQRKGCHIKGHSYKVGEVVRASSGPCLHCTCGGDGQMKCDPKACTPEPMLRQMIAAAVSARRRR